MSRLIVNELVGGGPERFGLKNSNPDDVLQLWYRNTREICLTGVELDGGLQQAVPVDVITRPESDLVIVQQGGFGVGIRPLEGDKVFRAALSERTSASIVTIGLPGMEALEFRTDYPVGTVNVLSEEQRAKMREGSFDAVAVATARSLAEALRRHSLEDKNVIMLAPSLTGSIAPALTGPVIQTGLNLRGVGILDAVAYQERSWADLVRGFLGSARGFPEWLRQNPPVYQKAVEQDRKNGNLAVQLAAKRHMARVAVMGYLGCLRQGKMLWPLLAPGSELVVKVNDLKIKYDLTVAGASEYRTHQQTCDAGVSLAHTGYERTSLSSYPDTRHAMTATVQAFVEASRRLIDDWH